MDNGGGSGGFFVLCFRFRCFLLSLRGKSLTRDIEFVGKTLMLHIFDEGEFLAEDIITEFNLFMSEGITVGGSGSGTG